ncbi:MAG: cobalt ECF transporter T component CbiQ [Clostridiales Family XIII bacterium]|nr:cobalt ECF transporter T component CbiQ [Clostridiales Family XIII bacterium]
MKNKIYELYTLERLSRDDTVIHRLHPMAKMLAAFVFITVVVSFDRYAFGRLIPYSFYPAVLMNLAGIPGGLLFRRFLIAAPFCLFAGISNVVFDRAVVFTVAGLAVSQGLISLFVILFRAWLCVMAVLILVSTTPFAELSSQMRRLKIPGVFVVVFEMTYRYIGVLAEEVSSMYTAYLLRSVKRKGIEMRHIGSFMGQFLLRGLDRAERVYSAMKCRGYSLRGFLRESEPLVRSDVVFLGAVCFFCALFRVFSVETAAEMIGSRL